MTTANPRLRPLQVALALSLAAMAHAQGPCLDLSPNDIFEDGIQSRVFRERAVRVTNGPTPLTIHYVELFTGETSVEGTLTIRAHDAARDQPGPELASGSWDVDPVNSWQGAVMDRTVTLGAGEIFWVTRLIPGRHQAPIERRVTSGGDVTRFSEDGGQTWSAPYDGDEYKYRFFCETPARARNYGIGCGGSTGRGPDATFFERFDAANRPLDLGTSVRFSPQGNGWTVTSGQDAFDTNYSGPLHLVDDELGRGLSLGFDFPLRGGGTTDTIDVDPNGSICLISDPNNDSEYEMTAEDFGLGVPRIAIYEEAFLPSTSGQIYLHTGPGIATVTWVDVPQYQTGVPHTFQLQLHVNGDFTVVLVDVPTQDGAIGYSQGSVQGLRIGDISDPQNDPVFLGVDSLPRPGSTLQVTTSNLPAGASASSLGVGFLRYEPAIDLAPLGMPNCSLLTRADILVANPVTGTTAQTTLPIPNDTALIRLRVYLQSHALVPGANAAGLVLSDGVQLIIGR